MCLVRDDEDSDPLIANLIVERLSWNTTFSSIWYPWDSIKNRHHRILGNAPSSATNSDCLVELIKAKESKLHMEAEKYSHSRQSWKEACQSFMLSTLWFIYGLERKYVRHMDHKMWPIANNRSTLEHCKSYRYWKQKFNILYRDARMYLKESREMTMAFTNICLHIRSEPLTTLYINHVLNCLNSVITPDQMVWTMLYMEEMILHHLSL